MCTCITLNVQCVTKKAKFRKFVELLAVHCSYNTAQNYLKVILNFTAIPPHRRDFFDPPPNLARNSNQHSYIVITLSILVLQNPTTPLPFQSLLLGEYGY